MPRKIRAIMEVHSETNVGTEDEFNFSLKKIIEKQSDLVKVRNEFKKENEILTNNLSSIEQQNEKLRKEKESLKLLVLREQDDFDNVNARLINEMLTVEELFENVDTASKLAHDFIKKNAIVASFFDGISHSYNHLQDSINNMAFRITQENMHIKDKVKTSKLYKEKYQTDLQNDIVECEMDLENISNAASCLKKAIFQKQLELSKLSVTAEYVCEEELKDELNLQNLETQLQESTNDGRNCIDEEQSSICDLEKREETLRNTLKELKNDEEILRHSINVVQKNLSDLESSYREREREEKSCNEKLLLLNDTVDKLVKMKCLLENDLEVKENLNQDNERMRSAVLNLENQYKELISEKGDIESDLEYLQNDKKKYLAEIESEKCKQMEEIAAQEKIKSDTCSLNAKSSDSSEKHYKNVNLVKEEIENLKRRLDESENGLLQIQTSNAYKAQQVHDNETQLQSCINDLTLNMKEFQIETNKVEVYENTIIDDQKKYSAAMDEINATLILKKEELNAAERNAERISSLKQEIDQVKSELSKQTEQIQSDLQQIENDNMHCKNHVEERFETLKIQLENKNKKIQTELLEYQAGLTELENMEQKLKIAIAAIKDELANIRNKSMQLINTRNFLNSKVSKARKNLRSAIDDNKSDDVSVSQLSIDRTKREINEDDDNSDESSSGISTSDPRWVIPKNKSGSSSSIGERSQKK